MASRKQRERIRQARLAFDRRVAENRKNAVPINDEEKTAKESKPKRKPSATKKKTSQKAKE